MFKNLRSGYGKLKNWTGPAGKSGQASCRLTSRQEWKLRNLAFLDEVIKPRTQGQELGTFADEDDDDVGAREDFVSSDSEDGDRGTEGRTRGSSADSQDNTSKRNRNSISRKTQGAKSTHDVREILTGMLLENRRLDREMEKKFSVVRNCPNEKFPQFQMETLALSQRYQPTNEGPRTNGQQSPAPPPSPPTMFSPNPATSQFQHPFQQFHGRPQPQSTTNSSR